MCIRDRLLVAATVFSFIVAAAFPVALSYFIPRAWFVPVMLGLPLFALALECFRECDWPREAVPKRQAEDCRR